MLQLRSVRPSVVFCSAWRRSRTSSHQKLCGEGLQQITVNPSLSDHPNSFFCAMIAAISLRFLDPFGTGKLVLFQVTYDKVCASFLANACSTFAHRSIGLARTGIVVFRDSRGLRSKINLECVRRSVCSYTLYRAYTVLGSPSSTTAGARTFVTKLGSRPTQSPRLSWYYLDLAHLFSEEKLTVRYRLPSSLPPLLTSTHTLKWEAQN